MLLTRCAMCQKDSEAISNTRLVMRGIRSITARRSKPLCFKARWNINGKQNRRFCHEKAYRNFICNGASDLAGCVLFQLLSNKPAESTIGKRIIKMKNIYKIGQIVIETNH